MSQTKINAQNVICAGNYMFKLLLKQIDEMENPVKMLAALSTGNYYDKRINITSEAIEVLTDMVTAAATLGLCVNEYLYTLESLRKHKLFLVKSRANDNVTKN